MAAKPMWFLVGIVILISGASDAIALDYVVLKNGRTVTGMILRQDTTSVTLTDWEYRGLRMPPLQVYAKEEIESIWFDKPGQAVKAHEEYRARPKQFELAGGLAFQSFASTDYERAGLLQLSAQAGYTLMPALSVELDAIYTAPSSGLSYERAFQTALDFAVHPYDVNGLVPFILAGGGAATDTPFDRIILTKDSTVHNLIEFGAGIKTGRDGFGLRAEIRHHYYTWHGWETHVETSEGQTLIYQTRRRMEADATVFRVSVFTYF